MESYKVKQNLMGLMHAYLTPILLIFIIVAFVMQYVERRSLISLVYLAIFIPIISYRYFVYLKRPLEIEVAGDKIKMKDILGKITECSFVDITDIEVTKRRELYFTIKENKIRSLNTYKDFDKFLDDAKSKNPAIKLWGFPNR
jgi:hypothetical protein